MFTYKYHKSIAPHAGKSWDQHSNAVFYVQKIYSKHAIGNIQKLNFQNLRKH